jgi:hypothetical protein
MVQMVTEIERITEEEYLYWENKGKEKKGIKKALKIENKVKNTNE